ncbi:hypothetical protein BH09ACT3_BH09ACT3_11150 [soil metagenome]
MGVHSHKCVSSDGLGVGANDWKPFVLFDVAAVALTSGALGGVAEAFSLQEISARTSSVIQVLDQSDPFLGPQAGVRSVLVPTAIDPAQLPRLGGVALLEQLTLLSASDLSSYVASNPGSLQSLIENPPAATTVIPLWAKLSPAKQASLMQYAPELVGNLEGVPFATRNTANRAHLANSIAATKTAIDAGTGRGSLVDLRHKYEVLLQVERALTAPRGEPERQLLSFEPDVGDGRAAIAIGDISTADYVSYLVPGMFFTLQAALYDWASISQDLVDQQNEWVDRLATTDPSYRGKTVAAVAWIGYSTPGIFDIASLDRANEGATLLGRAITGIQSVRTGSEPYLTLVTHSYGSTAAMIELAKGGIQVDALVMIGSPGSAAQSASALSVKNDNVFVGEAAWDPVVNMAFYGSDPGASSFGAHSMSVAGGVDAVTRKTMAAAIGHLGYFDPGTEAMRNIALIGLGENALVTDGTRKDASRTLASR